MFARIRRVPIDPSVPKIARLRTLVRWSEASVVYFDTGRSNNGGPVATNGLVKLHRRVAHGLNRHKYRCAYCSSAADSTPSFPT